MSTHHANATALTEALSLKMPPIAVSLAQNVPDGVAHFDDNVAGGCRFWEEAATRAFATSTKDHALCAIGVYTHNMAAPSDQTNAELGEVLKVMSELTYVRDEDIAAIPKLTQETKHVVYAPLASAPLPPDVVLIFAHSAQGLILAEAAQQVEQSLAPALGRPACAIIPQVINTKRAATSLGCCGARAYLDNFTDDVALWGLPGDQLDAYVERITALASANTTLATFHQLRRQDVEAGKLPSFKESLSRLG